MHPGVGPKFKVEKAAPASYNADGTVATWADAGTTGAMIHLESGYTATIYYQVRVTNSGDITASHPAIIDTPTLPAGFVLAPTNTIAVNGVTRTLTNGSYTIPAGSTPMAKGEVTVYTVAMNVRMNVAPHTVDWATLGTCNTEP